MSVGSAGLAQETAAPAVSVTSELPPLVVANGKMDGNVELKLDMDAAGSVTNVVVVSSDKKSSVGYAIKMAKMFRYPNRSGAKGVTQHVVFHPSPPPGVKNMSPEYPAIARMAHVSGPVVMAGALSADGYVSGLQLISGEPMLQKASLDAASHWAFVPQTLEGAPVACRIIIQINYDLTISVIR